MKERRVNPTDSDDTRSVRVPARLSPRLEGRLASYAMAAGAAGVGLLAPSRPAKADIVYVPVSVELTNPGSVTIPTVGLQLSESFRAFQGGERSGILSAAASGIAGVFKTPLIGGYRSLFFANALEPPTPVGRSQTFNGRALMLAISIVKGYTLTIGYWPGGTDAYLGFKFLLDGGVHYGWARVVISGKIPDITVDVTGYAYNTVPNQPIIVGAVPEPGTLGLLALGSLGLGLWRRRRQETVVSDK